MVYINAIFTLFSLLWLVSEVTGAEPGPALWFALGFTLLCAANTVNLLGGGTARRGRANAASGATLAGEPAAARPDVPAAYGVVDADEGQGLLSWTDVSQRLVPPVNYWICTTRPDGRPHSVPVWGVWLEDVFYFGTHPGTVKAHNLAANSHLSLHLDSSDKVIIVEGAAEEVFDPRLRARVDRAMADKYELETGDPAADANPLFAVRPKVAFAWSAEEFGASATRWTFA